MAIPIAITGSYFWNEIELTSSYATVRHIQMPLSVVGGTTDFTGSYDVDVYYNSESFALLTSGVDVEEVDSFRFSYIYELDEGDPDPANQAYDNLIASQSEFVNMTKKIYS